MTRPDNYAIQAAQARQRFLTYDQTALIRKCRLRSDPDWLYTSLFSTTYRICRATGCIQKQKNGLWHDANTHAETLTIFDLLCDSRADRRPAGRCKGMGSFGLMFHRNLLEDQRDSLALLCDRHPEALRAACAALNAGPFPGCDMGFSIPFFEDLPVVLQFWHGDEEFAPRLRWLWDENAPMYLRYETMYFALGILKEHLRLYFPENA